MICLTRTSHRIPGAAANLSTPVQVAGHKLQVPDFNVRHATCDLELTPTMPVCAVSLWEAVRNLFRASACIRLKTGP
jgi:hypothetical protein